MKILVPMDESVFAEKALSRAMHLAKLEPSALLVLSVVPLPGAVEEISPKIADKIRRSARALLDRAKSVVEGQAIETEILLEEGVSPANNIITVAEEKGIDLIVLGYRGKSNLEKFLLGSVALRVVSHAPCSVMVVK